MQFILSVMLEKMVRFLTTVDVVFRFDKSDKNIKNNNPKAKKIFLVC